MMPTSSAIRQRRKTVYENNSFADHHNVIICSTMKAKLNPRISPRQDIQMEDRARRNAIPVLRAKDLQREDGNAWP